MLANGDKEELGAYPRECSKDRVSCHKAEEILDLVGCHVEVQDQKSSELGFVRCGVIRSPIRELNLLEKEIALVKEKLKKLVEDAGYKLRTMPGVDFVTEARVISIIEDTNRFSSGTKIARFCGIAPCERSSGKRRRYKKSNRGERQLNYAIYCIAYPKLE